MINLYIVGVAIILLLDEPSVGQDSSSLEKMMNAIVALSKRKKMTTITISHDERCDFMFGDVVVKMNNGTIIV